MKRLIASLIVSVAAVVLFSACVPVTYSRSIIVHKDANGVVAWTEEHESITEPHSESAKIKAVDQSTFKYLK
jgi:hypothetical protein